MNQSTDEFTQRMFSAINAMLLDMLAAVSRKDYEDRRRRQIEGIKTAKDNGKYKGRQVNRKLHDNIAALLQAGKSYGAIVELLGSSRSTGSVEEPPNVLVLRKLAILCASERTASLNKTLFFFKESQR